MTNTESIFDTMTHDDRWLGFGYLGGRLAALDTSDPESTSDPALVAKVDSRILAHAFAHEWDQETMFAWANSKDGRWFADTVFGCNDLDSAWPMAARYLRVQA